MTAATWPVRAPGTLGVTWGIALLARGRLGWCAVAGGPPTDVDLLAVRVLGVRHLAQGTVQVLVPNRMRAALVVVDLLHVLTMLPVAVLDERRRRPAALTAAVALASAGLTLTTRRPPGGERS